MWTYSQTTGELTRDGAHAGFGYSGYGPGKNNPAMQGVANVGPIPQGLYAIGKPQAVESPGPHGPFVLPLKPNATNEMHGRAGFLIHSDSISKPGFASRGCVIIDTIVRHVMAASGDADFTVTL